MPRTQEAASTQDRPDQNAVEMLKRDHETVRKLFQSYKTLRTAADADPQARLDIVTDICSALTVHAWLEQEIFYPALRDALDQDDLLDEAEVEHASARELIAQLREMTTFDRLFDATVMVLGEYIDHHVAEEEGEMFTKAQKSDLDLDALGAEMNARRPALEAEFAALDDADGEEADPDEGEDDDEDEDEDEDDQEDDEPADTVREDDVETQERRRA